MKKLLSLAVIAVLMLGLGAQIYAQDDLTETYTSDLEDITISYPEGWQVVSESGLVFVVKGDEDVVNASIIPEGSGALMLLPPDFLTLLGMDPESEAEEIIQTLGMLIGEDGTTEVGEAEETTLENEAENKAVIAPVTGLLGDGFIAIVTYDVGVMGVFAIAASGELEDFDPDFRAMLNSLVYQEPKEIEKPEDNAVSWETETVSLSASNFYIVAGGKVFTADVDNVEVDGDPGSENYTTLEVTWEEHGVEMRVYMYFEADGENWYAYEVRTYDGAEEADWVYYEDEFFTSPLGQAYSIMAFGRQFGNFELAFNDLSVQAFTSAGE